VILENSAKLAATTQSGSGGDIQLQNLSSLQLNNNSEISASTQSGKGGNVSVNAPGGTVALTGNSSLKAEATNGGNAGNLDITANQLRLRDSSSATVSSTGGGTAGKLAVSAPEVILENSAKLAATTQSGSGGDIQLQNISSLQLSNNSEISASTTSGKGGNVSVNAQGGTITLTDKSSLKAEATQGGQAGNLEIIANQLTLRDSIPTVSSPQGQAGNLSITANNLLLDRGEITAETGKRSTQGGANINLQVTDLLLLRHNSLISATANSDANGGNITIKAPFVVAVPYENSDIIANAFSGDGGQINIIDNYRVFGLKPQNGKSFNTLRQNRTSDISASSQSGIQGVINIQSLSIDPSQGLTALPVDIVDPSRQIVNRCGAGNAKSTNAQGEFVVTGRGGLPPSPDDLQRSGAIAPGWVTRDAGNISRSAAPVEPPATPSTRPLVEAQGMFINAKGEVVLTAQTPTTTPHQPGIAEPVCSPATQGNE
jgi:large exoprotein involved in heme utilization and adhesion